jgi:hypothetical protein
MLHRVLCTRKEKYFFASAFPITTLGPLEICAFETILAEFMLWARTAAKSLLVLALKPGTLSSWDFYICHLKNKVMAGCRWLTPVILATQKAEIRRFEVPSQPGKIVLEALWGKKPITKKGW